MRKHNHLTEEEVYEKIVYGNKKRDQDRVIFKAGTCDICKVAYDKVISYEERWADFCDQPAPVDFVAVNMLLKSEQERLGATIAQMMREVYLASW